MSSRPVQLLLALSLLLNFFILAGFVYRTWIAPPAMEHVQPRPGGPLEMIARELKLDESQRKTLHSLFEKNLADRREHQHDIQQAREQLSDELKKPNADPAKIDALVEQVSKLRGELFRANLHAILELEAQLTPEQRERMHEILADRVLGMGPPRPGPGHPPR